MKSPVDHLGELELSLLRLESFGQIMRGMSESQLSESGDIAHLAMIFSPLFDQAQRDFYALNEVVRSLPLPADS